MSKSKDSSPKSLGYEASSEKLNTKRKGKDGNYWIVAKIKSNTKKWVKMVNIDKLRKLLLDKMYNWWKKLSDGDNVVYYNSGKYKTIKFKNKDDWINNSKNSNVKRIIWSNRSHDSLYHFVEYILHKLDVKTVEKLIKISKSDITKYLMNNFSKFFKKEKYLSNKDYTLKHFSSIESKNKLNDKLLKKFNKSNIIKKI